ncbi:MAG: NepR family anti-sigma factor [Pseudomonadota bacterium]
MIDKKTTDRRAKSGAFDKQALPDKIGNSLRQLYDDVLNEDIPDDFLNLLKKADEKSDEASK